MVVAPSTVEVVRSTGGWLFDLTLAGWDVAVLVPDHADSRPLQILGARTVDPSSATPLRDTGRWPEALAVDAELYAANAGVQELVRDALAQCVEVRLWDGDAPPDSPVGTATIQHRLSIAARAFKAQALEAAAEPVVAVEVMESFRGSLRPPLDVDPVPVA